MDDDIIHILFTFDFPCTSILSNLSHPAPPHLSNDIFRRDVNIYLVSRTQVIGILWACVHVGFDVLFEYLFDVQSYYVHIRRFVHEIKKLKRGGWDRFYNTQELIRLANEGLPESDPIYEAGAVEKLGRGVMK